MLLERAIFDIEMLRRAQFFIGNAASTFSYTVCLIRGRAAAEYSNICCDFFAAFGLDDRNCTGTRGQHSVSNPSITELHQIPTPHPSTPNATPPNSNATPLNTTQHHSTPLNTTQHHSTPLNTAQHHSTPLNTTQHRSTPLNTAQHRSTPTQLQLNSEPTGPPSHQLIALCTSWHRRSPCYNRRGRSGVQHA
jgi:hypothetical protein